MQKPKCDKKTNLPASNQKNFRKHEQVSDNSFSEIVLHPFLVLDTNGYFVGWNDSLPYKTLKIKSIRTRSINVIDKHIYHADQPLIKEKLLNILKNGLEETAEARVFFRGEQDLRWFMITGRRIMIEDSPFVICMIVDITSKKQEEDNLTQTAHHFRSITENIDGVVFVAGTNSILSYVSPAAEKMFGFKPDEMTGQSLAGFLEEEKAILETPEILNETCLNSFPTQTFELHFRRKNGSLFWGEVHLKYSQENGYPSMVGLLHDVTARKHMEAHALCRLSLFERADTCSIEELLKATLDETEQLTESSIGFCYFFRDDISDHALQVLSTNMDKKVGRPEKNGEPCSWNQTDFLIEALRMQKTVIHNDFDPIEIRWQRSDHDSEFMKTLVVPIMKGDMVTAIVGVGGKSFSYDEHDERVVTNFADLARDIVTRKRTEQSEKNIRVSLIQAQKMALLGMMVRKIGCDYNHLLEIIFDNVKQVMAQKTFNKSMRNNLRNILESACSSSDMMSQLLTFARSGSVMPIVIEMNVLVEGMLTTLRKLVGNDIDIVWVPDKQRTLVKIDPSQIDQLLSVFCLNARDAIDGRGQITIETGRISIAQDDCTSDRPCQAPGNYVSISVMDTGIGIKTKNLPHIFEPFFSTKEDVKGMGLGLSIAYGIAQQNQGSIDCQSEIGSGSTFTVHLPRYMGSDYFSEDEMPSSIFPLKETILLVENEPDILNLYKGMLENIGYTVFAVDTSSEAIQIARQLHGEIDLLMTDVVLSEVNGCDLSEKLLSICPNLKTLFISFYNNDIIDRSGGVFDERIDFIQKPFFIDELTIKVQDLLNPVAVY
jgi:two-component system cell cycle sensor histidine kinase/response regulator CckA